MHFIFLYLAGAAISFVVFVVAQILTDEFDYDHGLSGCIVGAVIWPFTLLFIFSFGLGHFIKGIIKGFR